jgi:FkbM family methyltransferase
MRRAIVAGFPRRGKTPKLLANAEMTVRALFFLDSRPDNGLHPTLIRWGGNMLSLVRFRLFWRLCRLLARLFPGDDRRVLHLNPHTRLQIRLRDPYWSQLVCGRFDYEHEIEKVIGLIGDLPFVFLDCGANIGYWSAVVTQSEGEYHKAIAVEADPLMFEELCTNANLNGDRFSCLHRAVSLHSGEVLRLQHPAKFWESGLHANTRVIGADEEIIESVVSVESICLDDIAERYPELRRCPVVVKLDVEGMEIAALEGAAAVLAANPLLVYEDHGQDRQSSVSQHVLTTLGYNVFAWDDELKRVVEIPTLDSVRQRKKRASIGYNFFACSSKSVFYPRLIAASSESLCQRN